jgi:tyrosinase
MYNLTRRSFLASSAAIPFSVWLGKSALAQAPRVRYDARSPQGQAMLKTYAKAVARMRATAEGDPRSWTFQWYSHYVKDSTTKDDEIARIYPDSNAWSALAEAMWDTCQAHGQDEDENFFLPWHRLFVYYFEKIVRNVSGDDTFTLPYWNYSAQDTSIRGVLPPEFRRPGDSVFKSLYIENRNPGVNQGQPIQQGQPGDPLSLEALSQCVYEPLTNNPGFCQDLDQNLHGNIHVLVGDTQNMGTIPWAAEDPIFWLHHCNIDRLWASWNAGGRMNPSLSQTFTFADENGQRVDAKIEDVLDLSRLGYTYDQLEAVPDCPNARPMLVAAAQTQKSHATVKATPVALGTEPVKVTLEPLPGPTGEVAAPMTAHVARLHAGKHLFLMVKDLKAAAQPGVLYHLYLELPDGASKEKREAHYVGGLNFFNAVGHAMPGHGGAAKKAAAKKKGTERFYRFDITDLAKKLHAQGLLKEKPILTIAPAGKPAAAAKPVVGEITVIEE